MTGEDFSEVIQIGTSTGQEISHNLNTTLEDIVVQLVMNKEYIEHYEQ